MSLLGNLFRSSVGRKFLMAITGFVLACFVTGHLIGNLQIFANPDHINGYAHFLQSLGPVLWAVRGFLLICVLVHVWAAVTLALENYAARGDQRYDNHKWLRATVSSRYMRHTGVIVAIFIVYHLLQFTVGTAQAATFKTHLPEYTMTESFHVMGIPVVAAGAKVLDVWSMVYLGFSNVWISLFYMFAIGLLTLHLWHGLDSMFQTIGWRNAKWANCLRRVVGIYCLLYFLGNIAIPGAVLAKVIHPPANTAAAQIQAASSCPYLNAHNK
ncbi:succinate dehydrogenase/fumarate reductase transmembrane subunit [mine drainage metagenome]|uniref:Succinate dehydrogenase/fumarate reductase transmembrane subunit n=1 Tax=mine drainage metagenome TaxID=410659 RepID=A0A1J5SJL8_9ZZZZ